MRAWVNIVQKCALGFTLPRSVCVLMQREMFISRDELLVQGPSKTSKVAETTVVDVSAPSGRMAASADAKEEIPVSEEKDAPPVSLGAEGPTSSLSVEPSKGPGGGSSPMIDPRRQSRLPSAKLTPTLASSGFSKTPATVVQQPKKVQKVNGALYGRLQRLLK